ncbi:MAG: 4-hydroxy-2-oxovalerate aldolase [Planctomycetes bacterium]|nr:4-hydroxy-2-oxovalerate aldolase [Planctomycetota bacterium]
MALELFDCTLRDGGNVTGGGVSIDATVKVATGLVANGIRQIEIGNTYSVGPGGHAKCAPGTPSDDEYLKSVGPLLSQASFGMFYNPKFGKPADLDKTKAGGMTFIRIGTNVGEVALAKDAIAAAKKLGFETRFALMKAWAATARKLADDCLALQDYGVEVIHLMDSTGSFMPDELARYCQAVLNTVSTRIAFHGHNNLGLSMANALAAYRAGIRSFDCSICGYARSAGNAPTEMLAIAFDRLGVDTGVDIFGLLDFIEKVGAAALKIENYVPALDVLFGMSGFHSSFMNPAKAAAEKFKVSLHKLIWETCKIDKINPSDTLFVEVAETLVKTK